jgi:foldase protein PrsA
LGTNTRALRSGRRRFTAAATALVVASALAVSACGSDGADLPDGVVAQVGDQQITQQQLDRLLEQSQAALQEGQTFPEEGTEDFKTLQRQAVQQLVSLEVIEAEARKCGTPCRVSDADVTKQLDLITDQRFEGDEKKLQEFLTEQKITLAEARQQVRAGLQQEKLQQRQTRGVRFSAADARAYYAQNRTQFRQAASREISHILVKTEAEAQRIAAEATPDNFADLAKRYSTDTGTKAKGGALGVSQKGSFVPEFEKVAFSLPAGQVSEPVKTQFGWHVILVTEITPARTIPFAEARAGIISSQITAKRDAAWQKWVDDTLASYEDRTTYASDDLAPATATGATATTPTTG